MIDITSIYFLEDYQRINSLKFKILTKSFPEKGIIKNIFRNIELFILQIVLLKIVKRAIKTIYIKLETIDDEEEYKHNVSIFYKVFKDLIQLVGQESAAHFHFRNNRQYKDPQFKKVFFEVKKEIDEENKKTEKKIEEFIKSLNGEDVENVDT